ncbi:MAG: hypothetical protein FWF07_03845 [Methanomassiliicoccaceae archaeon]|nr:hypothetical protein [Methanomassiliicoccaceae archaeon]
MKALDRYSLLCISVALIITLTVFITSDDPQDNGFVGTVHDIKATQSGFTFSLDDTGGGTMKCFARTAPAEFEVYKIKGTFSDDGSMLFVSSMQAARHNEF